MFPVGDADAGGADIEVAMLMVTALRWEGVEIELDVNRVGGEKVVIMVCVGKHMEVLQSLAPLLGALCGRWVAKKESDVDEANCKDGFGAFDVLAVVDESGEGLV